MAAGRPRSFDKDIALEKAMKLYWKQGYANTSLVDLTETLGITKPSLYAAFGGKEQLFISALELYAQQQLRSSLELRQVSMRRTSMFRTSRKSARNPS